MSYESAKTSTNLGSGETMTSDMPSQPTANNFYANNNSRAQAMMMNPMMTGNNYYNGPQQGAPSQQNQMPNRPMYQGYPPGAAPPPPHPQHHQIVSSNFTFIVHDYFILQKKNRRIDSSHTMREINLFLSDNIVQLSPFDTCEPRANTYYSSYPHETGVYEHQSQTMGRNYYGNYHEHHMEVVHPCDHSMYTCMHYCIYPYLCNCEHLYQHKLISRCASIPPAKKQLFILYYCIASFSVLHEIHLLKQII